MRRNTYVTNVSMRRNTYVTIHNSEANKLHYTWSGASNLQRNVSTDFRHHKNGLMLTRLIIIIVMMTTIIIITIIIIIIIIIIITTITIIIIITIIKFVKATSSIISLSLSLPLSPSLSLSISLSLSPPPPLSFSPPSLSFGSLCIQILREDHSSSAWTLSAASVAHRVSYYNNSQGFCCRQSSMASSTP